MEDKTRQDLSQVRMAVCTPHGDMVHADFAHDLAMMWGHTIRLHPEMYLVHWRMSGSLIPAQREGIAEAAIKDDCTHLLWLDTDMHFPPDLLLYMLGQNKRILAGNYVERRPPFRPIAFPDLHQSEERLYTEPEDTGQVEVEAVGFGCVMIQADVFQKLPKPWFGVGYAPPIGKHVGEDVWFCSLARDNGETIWLDHDVSQHLEHAGMFRYSMRHGIQWREAKAGAV